MTEAELLAAWARAFVVTLLVEGCIATPLLSPSGAGLGRRLGVSVIAQFVTHPIVWFVLPALHLRRGPYLALAEGWAFVAEGVVYTLALAPLGLRRAFSTSLLANGASFALGLLLFRT